MFVYAPPPPHIPVQFPLSLLSFLKHMYTYLILYIFLSAKENEPALQTQQTAVLEAMLNDDSLSSNGATSLTEESIDLRGGYSSDLSIHLMSIDDDGVTHSSSNTTHRCHDVFWAVVFIAQFTTVVSGLSGYFVHNILEFYIHITI